MLLSFPFVCSPLLPLFLCMLLWQSTGASYCTLNWPLLCAIWGPFIRVLLKRGPQTAPAGIYIYAVKLKTGPRFGGFQVKNWSKFKVKNCSKFFTVFPIFIVFWGIFRNTNSAAGCQNSVFTKFGGCQKWGFRKENCIFCFFFFMLER